MNNKKVALIILDGFGISKKVKGNAIKLAKTPNIDKIKNSSLTAKLEASGTAVGLPKGQIGNSEVGHVNIGAGRVIYQDLIKINRSIKDKSFFKNESFNSAIDNCIKNNSNLHIMGLLSDGGVHSHIKHLLALLDLCQKRNLNRVYIHAFLDGRDTYPMGGLGYLKQLENYCNKINVGKISSIMGRFYSMDRDRRWNRLKKAYDALVNSKGLKTDNYFSTIQKLYDKGETDEFIRPIIVNNNYAPIKNKDSVIHFNFRPDRAREMTTALTDKSFNKFSIKNLNLFFVTMTMYDKDLKNVSIAFKKPLISNNIGEFVSNHGLKQIRIAETEKYAHVTYFINGEREKEYKNEDRILIPSLKSVKTYDEKPEMSAYKIKDAIIDSMKSNKYNLIIANFANSDMVGHTGNLSAAVEAVEHLDKCLSEIYKVSIEEDYILIITADHGNSEEMIDVVHNYANTKHTTNLVPLYIHGIKDKKLKNGKLSDISPTILDIMGYIKPKEMTGKSLLY